MAAAPGQLDRLAVARQQAAADEANPQQRAVQLASLAEELQQQGRMQDALEAFGKSIEADPDRAVTHCNLGNLWQQLDNQDQAIVCCQRALELDEQLIPARQNLGYLLFNHGRTEDAVALYDALLRRDPSPLNRLLAASVLPVVYDSAKDVAAWRQRLTDRLDALIADDATVDATQSLVPTSFFLAYHGQNDAELLRRLGRICRGRAA